MVLIGWLGFGLRLEFGLGVGGHGELVLAVCDILLLCPKQRLDHVEVLLSAEQF